MPRDLHPEHRRRILVTGGTGKTGSRVVAHLSQRLDTHLVVGARSPNPAARNESVHFDWNDLDATARVLREGRFDAVYLVPPPRDPDPATTMTPLLEIAAETGVSRAVLLGAKPVAAGDPGVGRLYGELPRLFDQWAILRPTWFMQDFVTDHYLANMVREGILRTASADGRIAYIDADDVASSAAALLGPDQIESSEYELTGPEALTAEDVAGTLTQALRRPIRVERMPEVRLAEHLSRNMPAGLAAALAHADATYSDTAVTETVQALTGRRPRSLQTFLTMTGNDNASR
jgi:uncharacterized protein YbjT (DUF2867 family)